MSDDINSRLAKAFQAEKTAQARARAPKTAMDHLVQFQYEQAMAQLVGRSIGPYAGPSLAGLNLRGKSLAGLDLRGNDFTDADLSGADLSGADVRGCNFTRAKIDPRTNLNGAQIDQEPVGLGDEPAPDAGDETAEAS